MRIFKRLFCSVDCYSKHQPLHAVAWNGEYVIEVRNTRDTQSLPAAKNHFGRELTDRAGNERDYDRANVFENCFAGQDHDRSGTDWTRYLPCAATIL